MTFDAAMRCGWACLAVSALLTVLTVTVSVWFTVPNVAILGLSVWFYSTAGR